jgi:hypothetical protein
MDRLQIAFFDESHAKLDEVCVRVDSFRSESPNAAIFLQDFFRESLLVRRERERERDRIILNSQFCFQVLETRMQSVEVASSFEIEIVCRGLLDQNVDWLLADNSGAIRFFFKANVLKSFQKKVFFSDLLLLNL